MTEDERQAMNEWADRVVRLEEETVKYLLKVVRRLAADHRLLHADRKFAQSQVDSIRQARRRLTKETTKR